MTPPDTWDGRERRITLGERAQAAVVGLLGRLPDRRKVQLSGEPPVVVEGQTLDPMLQLIRRVRRFRNPHGLAGPTIPIARRRFRREMLVYTRRKTPVWQVRELDVGGLRARHYVSPRLATSAAPLLVFYHGGGFAIGDLDTHEECCRVLCATAGLHVLSVEYRLTPEHPYPAALNDARASYRWARANAAALGADPDRVAVGGDSAGGNLAAVVSMLESRGGAAPQAQLLIYPVVDSVNRRPSHALFGQGFFLDASDRDIFASHYTAGTPHDPADPCISPLLAPSLAGLPPAVVATAGFDILRDEGLAYAERLRAEGTPVTHLHYPSLVHGFVNMTTLASSARKATEQIARALASLLGDGRRP